MQPGPPRPAEVLAHGTEPPAGAATSLHRGRLTLALVAALGLVTGGLVMDRYTALTDERERRSAVALVARVQDLSTATTGNSDALTLYVRLTNVGPRDLAITRVAVDATAVRSLPQEIRPVPVSARGGATVSVDVQPACPRPPGAAQWRLRLAVRTQDGAVRTHRLPLEDDRAVVRQVLDGLCTTAPVEQGFGVLLGMAEPGAIIGTGPSAVYRVRLSLELHGPASDLVLTDLRARTPALSATLSSGTKRPLTLDWRVRDCGQARMLRGEDYNLSAVGRLDGGSGPRVTPQAYLDGDLLIALARFVGRMCG